MCESVDNTVLGYKIVVTAIEGISQCGGLFVYLVVKVPSVWVVIKISRNGMGLSGTASSTVNWMEGSTVLMCLKNSSLCDWCWITSVINIPHPVPLGVQCSCDGSVFKSLHVNVSHNCTDRLPHGSSFGLLKDFSHTFSLFYLSVSYFIYKFLTVVNMVYGLTNKGF